MTCIVGLRHEGKVYIGGDSAGVADYSLTVRADEKVFINGEFIMGFTSSFRMGQLLRYALRPPEYHPDVDMIKYMVTDFINAVRKVLKDGGWAQKDKEVERGGTFLVGFRGQLFKVDVDFQVGIPVFNFDACGCGQEIALGSMFSSVGKEPEERVLLALEAAEQYSAGVRRPFIVKNI